MKGKSYIWLGLLAALIVAFFLSPYASNYPDGLEKVAEKLGFIDSSEGAETWTASPAPDYEVPGVGNSRLATGLAGAAGTIVLFALGWGAGRLLKRKRSHHIQGN